MFNAPFFINDPCIILNVIMRALPILGAALIGLALALANPIQLVHAFSHTTITAGGIDVLTPHTPDTLRPPGFETFEHLYPHFPHPDVEFSPPHPDIPTIIEHLHQPNDR
jgi:hypothetical protein